ncbi:hypothetical protein GOODEAATRI_020751 [Goodea atripinnis]|uniref:Uncharacterized protein n=1 Tax=Goodea atripinnis TaxID=208336 RepID=A0ABV0PZQ7_9TELE
MTPDTTEVLIFTTALQPLQALGLPQHHVCDYLEGFALPLSHTSREYQGTKNIEINEEPESKQNPKQLKKNRLRCASSRVRGSLEGSRRPALYGEILHNVPKPLQMAEEKLS